MGIFRFIDLFLQFGSPNSVKKAVFQGPCTMSYKSSNLE